MNSWHRCDSYDVHAGSCWVCHRGSTHQHLKARLICKMQVFLHHSHKNFGNSDPCNDESFFFAKKGFELFSRKKIRVSNRKWDIPCSVRHNNYNVRNHNFIFVFRTSSEELRTGECVHNINKKFYLPS